MSKPNQQSAATEKSGPKAAHRKRASQREDTGHPVFEANAAGIDIGAREIYISVPADRDEHPVRKCETFTGDLHEQTVPGPVVLTIYDASSPTPVIETATIDILCVRFIVPKATTRGFTSRPIWRVRLLEWFTASS